MRTGSTARSLANMIVAWTGDFIEFDTDQYLHIKLRIGLNKAVKVIVARELLWLKQNGLLGTFRWVDECMRMEFRDSIESGGLVVGNDMNPNTKDTVNSVPVLPFQAHVDELTRAVESDLYLIKHYGFNGDIKVIQRNCGVMSPTAISIGIPYPLLTNDDKSDITEKIDLILVTGSGRLSMHEVLLDNQASLHVFKNESLVSNIVAMKHSKEIGGIDGTQSAMATEYKCTIPVIG